MRYLPLIFLNLFLFYRSFSQPTFKIGTENFKTGIVSHQYNYEVILLDSFKLRLIDSSITYVSKDSLVSETINFSISDGKQFRSVNYFNARRLLIRHLGFSGNDVIKESKYLYDESTRRMTESVEDDKRSGVIERKVYEYLSDKIIGDEIIMYCLYRNGKIESFTKEYYDKSNRKYKEVKLADNKKDIVHTESFIYGQNGKLRERSIYFNELKHTKTFKEPEGLYPDKCFRNSILDVGEKMNVSNRIFLLKKFLNKQKPLLLDKECNEYEYKFKSYVCDIVLKFEKKNNYKQLILIQKERYN